MPFYHSSARVPAAIVDTLIIYWHTGADERPDFEPNFLFVNFKQKGFIMALNELPIPSHFNPQGVGKVWQVPYESRAADAENWAKQHNLQPASSDKLKISLLLVNEKSLSAFRRVLRKEG